MERDMQATRVLAGLLFSIALGAIAMYVLDPDKGRRRRAIARDKTRRLVVNTQRMVRIAARDTRHRLQGLRAQARHLLERRREAAADDLLIIERVRARLGRIVSHPHAIQVGARDGRVTLSGPILAEEVSHLLNTVRSVWGVADVDNRLVVHEHPEFVPSLQGGLRRVARPAVLQDNWAPMLRLAALLGGTAIALYGVRNRTLLLTGAGLGLAARGVTNVPLTRLASIPGLSGANTSMDDEPTPPHLDVADEAANAGRASGSMLH